MSNSAQAYPLHWPEWCPRTTRPVSSKFKTSLSGAIKNVQDSIRLFANDSGKKAENIIISSNFNLTDNRPKDAGVAVYFLWNGVSTCFPVDKYLKIEENLQAIHHCIEAERVKLRHGGIHFVTASFRAQAALPPPTLEPDLDWWKVLMVSRSDSITTIESSYLKLRSRCHPDRGGNPDEFDMIQKAWNEAVKEKK